MSVLDKVIAAVTPAETHKARREARAKARECATPGDWLERALDHHLQIEAAFSTVRVSTSAAERLATLKSLSLVLTGHSNAEESVLYPALARADAKGHATTAYAEQALVKMQMGALDTLPPMSQEFLDKLESIRDAVQHHMYEEEGKWFLELRAATSIAEQAKLSERYQEEFERYVGSLDNILDESDVAAPMLGAGWVGQGQDASLR
jgi:hypothetical protein